MAKVLIVAVALVCMVGCNITSVSPTIDPARRMTAPVQALYAEATAAFQTGDFEKAGVKYQLALERARILKDEAGVGSSLAMLGSVHHALKQYSKALEFYSAALPHFAAANNRSPEAFTLRQIGDVHRQMGNYNMALQAFDRSLTIWDDLFAKGNTEEKLDITRERAPILFFKAGAHENLGQLAEAVKTYSDAAADFQTTGELKTAGSALWGAAEASMKMSEWQNATNFYADAFSLFQKVGDLPDATWTKWGLGLALLRGGDFEEAAAAFTKVIEIAEREKLSDLLAEGYFGLGEALERSSDFEKALASYRSALRHVRAGNWENKAKLEAGTLLHMGGLHRWLSQYEEAIEHLRAAALKYRDLGNAAAQADSLAQLAEIFFWVAEPNIAVGHYRQALEIYRTIGNQPKQIEILAALGEAGYLTDALSTEDGEKYFDDGQQLVASLTGFDPIVRVRAAEGKTFTQEELNQIFQEWRQKLPTLKTEYRMAVGTFYQKWGRSLLEGHEPQSAQAMLFAAFEYHSVLPPLRAPLINREIAIELAKDAYFLGEGFRQTKNYEMAINAFQLVEQMASLLRTPEIHFAYSGLARTYADLGDVENGHRDGEGN